MEKLSELIDSLAGKSLNVLHQKKEFVPGESDIPVTGKVFGKNELVSAISASLDFWLTIVWIHPQTQIGQMSFFI